MASHLASLWKWDFLELGNDLLRQLRFRMKYISMLYKSSVLPILEYAAPVWSPYLEKDIHLLECVQNLFILSRMLQDNVKQK